MFALCLQSLLASPPDLVLLEFGINAAAGELHWFGLLRRWDPNFSPSPPAPVPALALALARPLALAL